MDLNIDEGNGQKNHFLFSLLNDFAETKLFTKRSTKNCEKQN